MVWLIVSDYMVQTRTFSLGHRVSDPDLAAAKHKAQGLRRGFRRREQGTVDATI